jgi:glycosyltransferase involved in cell wall biosynthesis
LRPALYYPWVYLKGGAERVLVELMQRSRHDWTLFTNRYEPRSTFPEFAGLDVVPLQEVSVRRSVPEVAKAAVTLLTQRLELSSHDALFVVSEGLGNLVAARSSVPTSCICLTPLKIAYDEFTRAHYFRQSHRLHQRLAIAAYTRLERPAWRQYERVFCNSAETRRRVFDARLVDPSRLEIAYHGVDIDRFYPTGEREPFLLVAGRMMWAKHIELAIRAWRASKPHAEENPFRLVIAGMVDAKSQAYVAELRRLATGREDIVFIESPSDDDLIRLYQRCTAAVFSAFNEDWGLVPLEAMACGKPVIATDRGGPRESIVHGETGWLVRDDVESFAARIGALFGMTDAQLDGMGRAARARAELFTWNDFVERVDEHVEELTASRRAVLV